MDKCGANRPQVAAAVRGLVAWDVVLLGARVLRLFAFARNDGKHVLATFSATADSFVVLAAASVRIAARVNRRDAWSPRLLTLVLASHALLQLVLLLRDVATSPAFSESATP